MQIKRHYHRILNDAGAPMVELTRDAAGNPIIDPITRVAATRLRIMRDADDNPVVRGATIKRMPRNKMQKFTPRTIERGQAEGWLQLTDDEIVIQCEDRGAVIFTIIERPGRNCLHCDADLPDTVEDPLGYAARVHIRDEHGGELTPNNKRWPHGYCVRNYYLTKVEG